jgi:hypothetical protein
MSTPSDWAAPVIKFKKLDDLPKGAPNTADQVMVAMRALHKMVHAQALAYGGKNSKLLPVGITEAPLLQQVTRQLDEVSTASVDDDMEAAYMACNRLCRRIAATGDDEALELLHIVIEQINSSLAKMQN